MARLSNLAVVLFVAAISFAGTWIASPGKGSHGAAGGGGVATLVQTKTGTSALATVAATWDTPATAGNLLLIIVASDAYNATPPTGFTESTGCGQEGFLGCYIWWKVAAGGETSVNYTIGSAASSAWNTAEINGPIASPYDTSAGQHADSTANDYTTPAITPSTGARYLVAAIGGAEFSSTSTTLGTWLNTFTERADTTNASGTSREVIGFADRSVTGDGSTTYSSGATYSHSGIDARAGIIISFKLN